MSHRPEPSQSPAASQNAAHAPDGQWRSSCRRLANVTTLLMLALLGPTLASGCGGQQPTSPSPADQHAAAIREVFRQDKAAGLKCQHEVKTDRLAAMRSYVDTLKRIDLRSCPADFQEVFLKHRYAWEEIIPFLEKYDGFTGDLTKLFELGAALFTDLSLTTAGDRQFERLRKGITATYFDVEKVGLRYGVQVEH